jgi:hypothetical protein
MAIVTTVSHSQSAILVDVSGTGACVEGSELPHSGEQLFATIEGTVAFGNIVWEHDNLRGIAFDDPLTVADLQSIRNKVIHGRGVSPETRAALEDWALGYAR